MLLRSEACKYAKNSQSYQLLNFKFGRKLKPHQPEYRALAARGFVKGFSHDLLSQAYCKEISILTFTFFFEKNSTLECFNCSTNIFSFEETILTLHSIAKVKEKDFQEHTPAHFGDFIILTSCLLYLFKKADVDESFFLSTVKD